MAPNKTGPDRLLRPAPLDPSPRDSGPVPEPESPLKRINRVMLQLGSDYAENVRLLTGLCGEILGADCALYNRLEGKNLHTVGQWNPPPGFPAVDRAAGRICTTVIRQARDAPLLVRDLPASAFARSDPHVARFGLQTYLGCAVRRHDRTVGSLCALYTRDLEIGDEARQIMGLLAAALSVEEERWRAEEEIRKQEYQYRTTIDGQLDMIHVVDRELNLVLANRSFRDTLARLGLDGERIIGRSLFEVQPFLSDAVRAEYQAVFASGQAQTSEDRLTIAGRTFFTETRKIPILENERTERVITIIHDITRRIRGERVQDAVYRISEAAASAPTLAELFHSIHLAISQLMPARNFYIAIHDPATDTLSFPCFIDQYDETPAPKRLGRGLTEYVLRSGRLLLATPERFEELAARGEVESVGSPSLDWLGVPLKAGGRVIGAMVVQTYEEDVRYGPAEAEIMTYVSEQVAMAIQHKRTEAELQRSEAQFRAIFEQAGIGIALTDHSRNRLLRWNAALQGMLGYSDAEMSGLRNSAITAPEDLERERRLWEEVQQGRSNQYQLEKRYLGRDGKTVRVSQTSTFIRDPDGRLHFGIDIIEDITQRLQMEEQFRQAQKMETVGRLAGGVAHDFNNLLGGMVGYADLLLENLRGNPTLGRYARGIRQTAELAAGLTRQLLAFSRDRGMAHEPVDIHQAVGDVTAILEHTLDKRIRVVTRPEAAAFIVDGDASQLQTALLNLCINARDAMPEGGTMTVATANPPAGTGSGPGEEPGGPGTDLLLTVSDTGVGMPAEVREHIFEPFFTTKAALGTGLGLSVVYATIREHGGEIQVESEPGAGSRFIIRLPATRPRPAEPPAPAAHRPPGSGCILLIDDEPVIRDMGQDMLRELGYEVLLAEDGLQGLAVFERERARIRLVILDVVMPRLNGPDTLRELRRLDPKVRVLMSSGFSFDVEAQSLLDQGACGFVAKPYRLSALAEKIEVALTPR